MWSSFGANPILTVDNNARSQEEADAAAALGAGIILLLIFLCCCFCCCLPACLLALGTKCCKEKNFKCSRIGKCLTKCKF